MAEKLLALARKQPELNIVFKGSFDKANRTSVAGPRGTGPRGRPRAARHGPARLRFSGADRRARDARRWPAVAAVCDVLQIPAFLCRQTDLLLAAAATGRVVNVKKGQFLSPQEMPFVIAKLKQGGAREIWQTERGTTFGYQNLVVDMRSFALMKANGCPAIFDASHSVQLPGAAGGKSGGQREFIPPLARAALAAGADGLFIETHPQPAKAITDGPNMIPLAELPALLATCLAVWRAVRS